MTTGSKQSWGHAGSSRVRGLPGTPHSLWVGCCPAAGHRAGHWWGSALWCSHGRSHVEQLGGCSWPGAPVRGRRGCSLEATCTTGTPCTHCIHNRHPMHSVAIQCTAATPCSGPVTNTAGISCARGASHPAGTPHPMGAPCSAGAPMYHGLPHTTDTPGSTGTPHVTDTPHSVGTPSPWAQREYAVGSGPPRYTVPAPARIGLAAHLPLRCHGDR